VQADAYVEGKKVPGIVFMRGGAVSILVVLHCGGQRFVLICKQPRIPVGASAFAEIPAGMLDGDGKFGGVAAKELQEETGMIIKEDEVRAFPATS
jgi:ADP-sugar diphosphatase